MTEYSPRLFAADAEIRRIGEGLLACTLVRADWTHEAHLAACVYVLVERPDIVPARDLPDIIRRFNLSVGGVNDATRGYHDTITQASIRGVRSFRGQIDPGLPLGDKVNRLLLSDHGRRDWPLRHYSPALLFSVPARLGFVPPDLAPLP